MAFEIGDTVTHIEKRLNNGGPMKITGIPQEGGLYRLDFILSPEGIHKVEWAKENELSLYSKEDGSLQ